MDSDAISFPSAQYSGSDCSPKGRPKLTEVPLKGAFGVVDTTEPGKESILADRTVIFQQEFSDEFLLEQLCGGNHGALALLFRRYARLVRTIAHRILRDDAEADDLLQEVFLFLFRKGALFDAARGSARSWIVQVTYHRAIDRRRHLASRNFYSRAELDETLHTIGEPLTVTDFYERTIEGVLGPEMLRQIEEALSSDQQKTMQLYFFEGYSFEEIADSLRQTVGNARNHYYRGLEKIRKLVFAPGLREK
jgi:RNA polymerase sigma-70 factor, ECF subfamily